MPEVASQPRSPVLNAPAASRRWPWAWALWIAVLATLVINWHRGVLMPPSMNPVQAARLAGLVTFVLAVAIFMLAKRRSGLAPLLAAALIGTVSLPADLWPLAAVMAVGLALLTPHPALLAVGFGGQLLVSLFGAYERIFGTLSPDSSSTLYQTSPHEAVNYLIHLVTPGWLVNQLAYAATLAGLLAWRRSQRVHAESQAVGTGHLHRSAMLSLGVLAVLASAPALLSRGLALRQGAQMHANHVRLVANATPPAPRQADQEGSDILWIVGESQSRAHWQLYGYPRPTSPGLLGLRSELVVLTDAVSPHSYTVQSMLLSGYRRKRDGTGESVSLLAMLRSAGVRVEWHSAQERFGPWASPLVRFAQGADAVQYHGSHLRLASGGRDTGSHPDRLAQAALLRSIEVPSTRSRVLVHHMFAAHDPYCAHTPAEALPRRRSDLLASAWFGASSDRSQSLDCYEGAVRFTDDMLTRYVQHLRQRQRPAILVFVPDHGESPEDGSGHNADRPSLRHLEIPVLIYMNPAARKSKPLTWERLQSHASQPFLGSWTYELMLELLGIAAPEVEWQSPPRLAARFRAPARIIFPDGRRWNYDGSPQSIDLLSATRNALSNKPGDGLSRPPIFAHRTNSVLKALEAARSFDGIEVDVVWDEKSRSFAVNHPPMQASGLTLDELLQAIAARPALQVWLDVKVAPVRPESALRALGELDRGWQLKGRSIVELPTTVSDAMFEALASAGWRTSMYLPDDYAACANVEASLDGCASRAQTWAARARRTGIRAFSFDHSLRVAIDSHLRPLTPGSQFLSWNLALRSDDPRLADLASDMAPLDALVVSFPSRFSP